MAVKFGAGEEPSFYGLWEKALTGKGTRHVHQVLGADSTRVSLYTLGSLAKLTFRLADGFRDTLDIKAGTRVAVLADGYGELLSVYHSLWLLGCTVVAVPGDQPPELTIGQINNTECEVLVYSHAMSARLASVAPALTGVKSWVVVGSSRSTPVSATRTAFKLEDLVMGSNRGVKLEDFKPKSKKRDHPALVAFTSGAALEPRGVAFNENTLLEAAQLQSAMYRTDSDDERVASLLPDKSLVSLVHMAIIPLLSGVPSVAFPEFSLSRHKQSDILEELHDNQVTAVWLNEHHLDDLRKATRSQRFVMNDNFRAYLLPTRPVMAHELEDIPDVVVPCYGQTEAGGIIACGIKGDLHCSADASIDGSEVLSCGAPLSGIQLKIVDESGTATDGGEIGEIVVSSKQLMETYEGSHAGAAYAGPDGFLHTGDRGFWSFDAKGLPRLVIVGRDEQFVRRGEHEVNILQIEAIISKVLGVLDVKVVGFRHHKYGKELGAFVLVAKRAKVTREILWGHVMKYFPWETTPKVFMIADSSAVEALPNRREMEQALARFAQTDFSTPPAGN